MAQQGARLRALREHRGSEQAILGPPPVGRPLAGNRFRRRRRRSLFSRRFPIRAGSWLSRGGLLRGRRVGYRLPGLIAAPAGASSFGPAGAVAVVVAQATATFLGISFSPLTRLIESLMELGQEQASDVLPLGDTDVALVAVILSVTATSTSDLAAAGGDPPATGEALGRDRGRGDERRRPRIFPRRSPGSLARTPRRSPPRSPATSQSESPPVSNLTPSGCGDGRQRGHPRSGWPGPSDRRPAPTVPEPARTRSRARRPPPTRGRAGEPEPVRGP